MYLHNFRDVAAADSLHVLQLFLLPVQALGQIFVYLLY